jgi:hypothetical protein
VTVVRFPVKPGEEDFRLVVTIDGEEYEFGFWWVKESHAKAIELKVMGQQYEYPQLPYDAAYLLAQHLCPHLGIRRDSGFLIAACEMALYSPNAGLMLFEILSSIADMRAPPLTPAEVRAYVMADCFVPKGPQRLLFREAYADYLARTKKAVHILFTDERYKREADWLDRLFAAFDGFAEADENVFAEPMEMIPRIGTPPITVKSGEVLMPSTPYCDIRPHVFRAMSQVVMSLSRFPGAHRCELREYCERSDCRDMPDEVCQRNPFLSANGETACPFCQILNLWGIRGKFLA